MKSLWDDREAEAFLNDPLKLRVYTSRLLGRDPALVMHGGGNTSVKKTVDDFFGDPVETLFVKGSGWDLATIEAAGFAPVRMDVLTRLATLEHLPDSDMVREQRSAMLDPQAPGPSVEAILHAILPFRFVDHTHADAVVTLTNTPDGEQRIRELYGDSVMIIPYVMPGFILARTIFQMTQETDWSRLDGMVLMNHGVFTFNDDGRESYERMIEMVDQAEKALETAGALSAVSLAKGESSGVDAVELARLRQRVGGLRGTPVLARLEATPEARGFADRDDVSSIATRGPLTPDHVIRTKRVPVVVNDTLEAAVDAFADAQNAYFERHADASLSRLDPAPRWAIWPGRGTLALGCSTRELTIIGDIVEHTCQAIQWAEHLGSWQALPEKDIFDVEYWELEQAKLRKGGSPLPLQGKVAWVTGAAHGIGKAAAEELLRQGAVVVGLDLDPAVNWLDEQPAGLGLVCDVTDLAALERARDRTARTFGGVDILVSNAGLFPASHTLEAMDDALWQRSLEVNLTSHQRVLKTLIPVLRHGFDPSVIIVASKNVPAPGPAAGAYSAAKAGLTQLARVAALELGRDGVRVNVLHPDGVFDTRLWTDEILAQRAANYGLTVEAYKTKNLLAAEVTTRDVATAVASLAGTDFRVTTGAQIPVDGGNDRVV